MDLALRKLLICSCFFLFLNATLSAQDSTSQAILSQSRATFLDVEDFSAELIYSLYIHPIQQEPASGTIMYKNKHFYIELGEQKIFCDGDTQWEFTPQNGEVRIFDHNPYQGIGLIFNIYLEGKESKFLGEDIVDSRICDVVSLGSLPGGKYDYAKIWIDRESLLPAKIFLSNPELTEVSLIFTNVLKDQALEDKFFHFDVNNFPNVHIIDERGAR